MLELPLLYIADFSGFLLLAMLVWLYLVFLHKFFFVLLAAVVALSADFLGWLAAPVCLGADYRIPPLLMCCSDL